MQPPEIPASEWALAFAELAVCAAFLGAFVFAILRTAHLKGERGNRLRLLAGFLLLAPMFQPNGETWLVPFVKGVYATGLLALVWIYRTAEDRGRLIAKWAISLALIVPAGFAAPAMGPYAPFLAVVVGFGVSVIWAPNLAALVSRPLTNVFDGGDEPDNRPLYSSAQAQRFQGHFDKAMELAREQLVHFPGDFDGQMLIAAVQAENLNDLAAATATIEETLSQSGREPHQISYALNTLADWQLKAGDSATAQATLERLVAMFPDTELAQQTVQRLSRLATTAPREKRAAVVMPEFERDLGLRGMKNAVKPPEEETLEQQAARYVARLEKYPTDWEAREQLALLYAEHYKRLDLAVEQLEQLIAAPNQPQKQVVHWLTRIGNLQWNVAHDGPASRAAYQRIIDLFPNSASATRAQEAITALNDAKSPALVEKATADEFIDFAARAGLKRKP